MEKTITTITDIAVELGLSPSTVSRALNDSPKISDETKKRVWDLANEMGYNLNLVASSLSKKRTGIIGVIIPAINRSFFSEVLSGIEEILHKENIRVIIAQSNESFEREKELIKMFSATRVDGIIACLSLETQGGGHFSNIQKKGISLVLFDRVHNDVECTKVIVDNYEGAFMATEHLIKSGCKNLAHLAGPLSCQVFEDRARGFREAIKANNLSLGPRSILSTDLTPQDVKDAMKHWMNMQTKPDGIFTASASTGLLLSSLAQTYKISIPDELSVISFGNEPCNEYIVPSLSAISMPGYDMGKAAAESLLGEIKYPFQEPKTIIKPIQLLIRKSTFKKPLMD
ncbi:MAG TPA: LacI family DNA-binding transcriptional regulator [Bacteroidales bacterium]|nr:LacI family DNA-binding transcriptional regulator [Bacteroidales bacterium]